MKSRAFLVWVLAVVAATGLFGESDRNARAAYPVGINGILWPTRAYYGDLSTGTSGGCTVSSGTTSLSADIFCSTMNISVGATLKTSNFRIYADVVVDNGTIDNSGNPGATPAAGAAVASGTLWAETAGGAGATGAGSGSAGGNVGLAWGNLSGTGGSGGSATGAGGAGGSQGVVAATCGSVRGPAMLTGVIIGQTCSNPLVVVIGGTGGGGGGSLASSTGGGGGAGGGVILIATRSLQGSGVISANGGAGGNAALGGGSGAGSGAGGGGGLILITAGDFSQWTGTTSVAAGAQGAKAGTGTTGAAASAGTVVLQQG